MDIYFFLAVVWFPTLALFPSTNITSLQLSKVESCSLSIVNARWLRPSKLACIFGCINITYCTTSTKLLPPCLTLLPKIIPRTLILQIWRKTNNLLFLSILRNFIRHQICTKTTSNGCSWIISSMLIYQRKFQSKQLLVQQ